MLKKKCLEKIAQINNITIEEVLTMKIFNCNKQFINTKEDLFETIINYIKNE